MPPFLISSHFFACQKCAYLTPQEVCGTPVNHASSLSFISLPSKSSSPQFSSSLCLTLNRPIRHFLSYIYSFVPFSYIRYTLCFPYYFIYYLIFLFVASIPYFIPLFCLSKMRFSDATRSVWHPCKSRTLLDIAFQLRSHKIQ